MTKRPSTNRRRRHAPPTDRVTQLFEALQHPWRRDVLSYMQREGPASASEIAKRLGVPVNSLAYHVRRLEQLGLIRQVHSVRRRGALMRVFEPSPELNRAVAELVDGHLVALAELAALDQASPIVADLDQTAVAEFHAEVASVRAKVRALEEATLARAGESPRAASVVRVALIAVVRSAGADQPGHQATT